MKIYQNYHKHTYFSNIFTPDSPSSIEEYVKRIKELGHKVISSVEHGFQSNYFKVYQLAKDNDLKFIFGTEAYWVKDRLKEYPEIDEETGQYKIDSKTKETKMHKDNTNCHMIILAKSEKGRKAINKVLSTANEDGYYYKPRLDLSLIMSLPENDVFITTACIAGWWYDDMDDIVLQLHKKFKNNFMLEVQYHNTDSQKKLNKHILELSSIYNIDIIAGMDSHFNIESDSNRRNDILEYKHIKYDNEEGWYLDYPDYDTAYQRFKIQGILDDEQITKALENTNIILDFDDITFDTEIKLPTLYPELSQEEKNQKLKTILNEEWKVYRIAENITSYDVPKYIKGIQEEYEEIEKTNMADYFLFNYEMIKRGKAKGGLITKRGRGSAPSFFMNTLLGFSKVDRFKTPIRLYPERFLTADRILKSKSLPDIDFNLYGVDIFAEAQRELIGIHSAYPMIAFGTLQKSAAFKLYAGAKGMDASLANEITKQIKKYEKALKYADDDEKEDILLEDYVDEEYISYIEASVDYQGIVVSKSQHPCAWILLNGDIREEIGIVRCESESTGKSVLVACIDGAMAEYFKFLKNDLLKVDVVGLTTKIWNRIGIPEPTNNQLEDMVRNDKATWDIYLKGLTMCINQCEKEKTKKKAMRYKISSTAELSAFVAAVRPAFASLLDNFLDRKEYTTGVNELDEVLSDSFHYMLYQESIMAYLNWLGINNKETYDILKKIAKKKFKGDELIKLNSELYTNWIKNVGNEEGFEESWKVVEDASAYAFNCSHSYCVGNDGVEIAYTKAHYPFETYEVCLNEYDKKKNKDKLMLLKQEMLTGFGIEEGKYKFGLDNRQFTLDKESNCINPSLSSIKGIGLKVAETLYELGKNKYITFAEVLKDIKENGINKDVIETLIKLDYFCDFGNPNQLLRVTDIYNTWHDKKSISKDKLSEYNVTLGFMLQFGRETNKKILDIDSETLYKTLIAETNNIKTRIRDRIKYEFEVSGYCYSKYPEYKDYALVTEVNTENSPKITMYRLDGIEITYKTYKKGYNKNPIKVLDFIQIGELEVKPKQKYMGKDENGKGIFIPTDRNETWMKTYNILN